MSSHSCDYFPISGEQNENESKCCDREAWDLADKKITGINPEPANCLLIAMVQTDWYICPTIFVFTLKLLLLNMRFNFH